MCTIDTMMKLLLSPPRLLVFPFHVEGVVITQAATSRLELCLKFWKFNLNVEMLFQLEALEDNGRQFIS